METWSLILGLLGAVGAFTAALWLLFGFKPSDPRFTDDGTLYPGRQTSTVVPNLLREQGRVGALVAVSASLQVLAVLLAIAAT